ncbi:class I SAM-dependent methyltransferase, partial [Candidatus Desantisbacteria bacterium]|nr:class I SAM-dependent methyltransferase [Candidatus Desantisbacteria bacterium]
NENKVITKGLNLKKNHIVADIGCGTGAFTIEAAQKCAKVYAVDISPAMLDYTKWKAEKLGLSNIVYCHAGFLTYKHEGEPLDAISTSMALHHLPDFWKQTAFDKMSGILKTGGRLLLFDVVFSENYVKNIQTWIKKLHKINPEIAVDITKHIRNEHSTFTWIIEGMLKKAGFKINNTNYIDGVLARYFCTKVKKS